MTVRSFPEINFGISPACNYIYADNSNILCANINFPFVVSILERPHKLDNKAAGIFFGLSSLKAKKHWEMELINVSKKGSNFLSGHNLRFYNILSRITAAIILKLDPPSGRKTILFALSNRECGEFQYSYKALSLRMPSKAFCYRDSPEIDQRRKLTISGTYLVQRDSA